MPTILITGAASGLGLQFVKHYLNQPHNTILALDIRSINLESHPKDPTSTLRTWMIEMTDAAKLSTFGRSLHDTPIDLVIHCAGIRGLVPAVLEETRDVAAAETWRVMDRETMVETLEVNSVGTFLLVQAVLPSLLLCAKSRTERKPKVVVMSSRMGSVSANTVGGGYAYRASKAALNAIVRSFSLDVPEVGWLLCHPGRVETGLVPWKEEGAMTVERSVGDVVRLTEGIVEEDERWRGGYVDKEGKKIEW